MKTLWVRLGIVGLGCLGFACSGVVAEPASERVPIDRLTEPLWRESGDALWPGGAIPVCFQGFNSGQRARIRRLVEHNWERAAKLAFTGWGTCPTITDQTTNRIVLKINPGLDEDNTGITGRSRHCQHFPTVPTTSCNAGAGWAGSFRFNQVEFTTGDPTDRLVLHEFGHAIGFTHETVKVTGNDCAPRTGGGTSYENEHDPVSVMIQSRTCGDTPVLSNWDVLGVRRAYGPKPTNSLVGAYGLCAAVQNDSSTVNTPIVGLPCSGARNTTFRRPFDLTLRSNPGGVERCMTVQGGAVSSSPTPVVSTTCPFPASVPAFEFHFRGVEWRAMGKMCVQPESAAAGAKLSIQPCDGSILQKWIFFGGNGRIQLTGTNLCVNVPASQTALGTEVILWPCAGIPASNELYTFSNGHITPAFNTGGKCLHVLGAIDDPGMRVGLWDGCFASPPLFGAQFTISGPVTGLGLQCLEQASVPFDGVGLGVRPCTGAVDEQWEYFF